MLPSSIQSHRSTQFDTDEREREREREKTWRVLRSEKSENFAGSGTRWIEVLRVETTRRKQAPATRKPGSVVLRVVPFWLSWNSNFRFLGNSEFTASNKVTVTENQQKQNQVALRPPAYGWRKHDLRVNEQPGLVKSTDRKWRS